MILKNNPAKKSTTRIIKISILIFVTAIIAVVAFYFFNPKDAITLIFPDLTKISNINTVIKNDSAFTKISMVLQNKNPYKLDIDTVDFEIKLSDTTIAQQTFAINIHQSSFDKDTIQLPLNLHIKQIMRIIKNLQKQDSTTVEVKGFIVYQTIFGRTVLDFEKKKSIPVPIPPQIKVLKVERKDFNFKDRILKVLATVEIINKGKDLDLQLTDIHYDFNVKNILHSDGIISKSVTVKPQSSIILTVPIEIEVYHPLKTAWLIKTDKDRLNYSLQITCKVKENVSGNAYTSDAEISATGIMEIQK